MPPHTLSISFLLFLISLPLSKPDLSSQRLALLSLRSSVQGRTLFWNVSDHTPCAWPGVHCQNDNVVELHLPAVALSGPIPTGIFRNLTRLRTLSLRFNELTGELPADLASCVDLRNLYLQQNSLSGEIPQFLFRLPRLVRLNLASNNFSGGIPAGFNNLTRLRTLFLENNNLSGRIPELDLLKLEQFNVSNNLLNGTVPVKLQSFSEDSFIGNSLCGKPLKLCTGRGNPAGAAAIGISPTAGIVNSDGSMMMKKKRKLSGGAIAGIVVGSAVFLILILFSLIILCRKRSNQRTRSLDISNEKFPEVEIPGGKEGEIGNGASAEVLGKGTFGTAYKAVLEVGPVVAVKRLKDVSVSEREFKEKIEGVGAMDHENLVPLRAYYYNRDEKLLVYDYMPMGSLSALLHGNKGAGRTPLNWEMRSSIALGAARGIEYLHSQGTNVSHGNIKSSNILLTRSYDARVSDFGLAHLVGPSSTPNRVASYRAPEVIDPRKVSQKADVYSFGVLLLELLTGKAPTHALLNEEGVDLPRWVQSVVREEWTSEVFDLELLRYQNVEEDMVQLLQLAVDCVAPYPDKRPSMSEVTNRIEELRGIRFKDDQNQIQQQPDLISDLDYVSSL
ncbi:putative inactive receptor kinase [Senna tora]|uniref:Putative inactive receptor kinase n=1 Tax=Senna tora TaxID=362788 RepID=A0A834T1Y0_9FABA|nr:putative inactive receptor kinase [Senna tora]